MRQYPVFLISFVSVIALSSLACGLGGVVPTVTPVPTITPVPTATTTPWPQQYSYVNNLVFAGKVVNKESGAWPNDRLVLLFLKGKEINRTITSTSEFTATIGAGGWFSSGASANGGIGIVDGMFVLVVPNTYELTLSTLGIDSRAPSLFEAYYEGYSLTSWVDPFYEGESREYYIPSRNITYAVKVMAGPVYELPAEIQQPGSTELREGNRLVAIDPATANATPQPKPMADGSVELFNPQEEINEFDPIRIPINNCGGTSDLVQKYTKTYIHKIINETASTVGAGIQILWFSIMAEVESRYGVEDGQVTTFETTMTVPAGQMVEYSIVRRQVWESGTARVDNNGTTIEMDYRVMKYEVYDVSAPEQKSCP